MEKSLTLPSLSRPVLLVFWLVVLCIPLTFLRFSLASLIREDERRLTEQARRDLREEMRAFVNDLHLSHQIHKVMRSIDSRASRLTAVTSGPRSSPAGGLADLLLMEIQQELQVEPLFLLVDPGSGLPPEIRYNSRVFNPVSAPSRRLAELWLRSLHHDLSTDEWQRLSRTVRNFLGEYVTVNINPDKVQETFSIRLGRQRLLVTGRSRTGVADGAFRGWIVAFLDRDFPLSGILKRASSQLLKHRCQRQVRSMAHSPTGTFFESSANRLAYSMPMPRLLFCQGGVTGTRTPKESGDRNQQPLPLLTVSLSGSELRAFIRPLQALIDPLLILFLGVNLLWVLLPEWRPRITLSLATRLYAGMLAFAFLPLMAFWISALSYHSLDQTLDTGQKQESISQRLEMIDSGLSAFATTQQTRVRGFRESLESVTESSETAIMEVLQRLKNLPAMRWAFFLRGDGLELRTLFMDGAPKRDRQFQEETVAAMTGGMRTYLKARDRYRETYVYPPGKKPPARSLVAPTADLGSPAVIEMRQGSFLRTIFPNLEEVFFTYLILPASGTPDVPRAACAMMLDPAVILQQYLDELRTTPDFLLQQDSDFRTEFRLFRFDPLQRLLLHDSSTPESTSEEEFELLAQRAIKSGQGSTLNLLDSPRPRLVQTRLLYGFPGVGVAIGRPTQSEETRLSFSSFVAILILYSVLIVLLLGRFLNEILVEPFLQFRQGVGRIEAGNYGTALALDTGDEFQHLGQAFNELSQELAGKERMKRFLSKRIVQAVENENSGPPQQIPQAAILVSDLRGFTTLSETHPAEQITSMLNSYFTIMEEAIQDEGGFIDKFIGDCLVAVFLPLEEAASPPRRALKAGLAMRKRLSAFNRERRERGEFAIDNGVGIALGPIISGLIKSGFKRRELGIFGDPVQEAYRLEARCRQTHRSGIVVSDLMKNSLAPDWPFIALTGDGPTDWELDETLDISNGREA